MSTSHALQHNARYYITDKIIKIQFCNVKVYYTIREASLKKEVL